MVAERGLRCTNDVSDGVTVGEAIAHLVEKRTGSGMAVNDADGSVAGVFTARDLLRWVHEDGSLDAPLKESVLVDAKKVAWCAASSRRRWP